MMVTFLRYDAFIEGARIPMATLFMILVFSLAAVFIQCQINVFRDINNEQLLTVPNGDFHFSLSFQIKNPKGKWAVSDIGKKHSWRKHPTSTVGC